MAQVLLNRVAVVTGAGGTLGRAIVERFLAEGAKVVAFGRNRARLEQLASQVPARVLVVEGDVTHSSDLASLAQTTARRFGGVDVLVCAAGIFRTASLLESEPEMVSEILDVNLRGALETLRALSGQLNAGASIVFLTASPEHASRPGCGAFSASKAALTSLAQTAAVELGPRGIRVNCVAPRLEENDAGTRGRGDAGTEDREQGTGNREQQAENDAGTRGRGDAGMKARESAEKTAQERGTVPFSSEDYGKSGQSPAVLLQRRAGQIADATLFFAAAASGGVTGQTLVVG
jgi:NAD(P)-dependent dehydrogenase (short-subunit alcohol dehydrogenase family)